MEVVQNIILQSARNIGHIMFDPIFFILAFVVIYLYKREAEKINPQIDKKVYTIQAIKNIAISVSIGIIVSTICQIFNIYIELNIDVLILIPIAIGLMFINPKWGCLAYTIPVAYLIEGCLILLGKTWIELPYENLIVLVGIMHMIEGSLVFLQGNKKAIRTPIFIEGKLKSGYIMKQLWIMPLMVTVQGSIIPLYTILAYADYAKNAKKQKRKAGISIFLYGVAMLFLSKAVGLNIMPVGGVIILGAIFHEFIFIISHISKKQKIK
ncbi:MAG: hypothetical protein ACRCSG_08775 [Cellulosilyticaceae bacterium]